MAGYGRREASGWDMALQGMNFLSNSMTEAQQIGENRYQADERDGVNKAYEYFAGKLGNTGDISQLDGDPMLNTRHGTMAMGQFMQQRASTETSRLQMLKAMEAADDQFYQKTFRPMAFAAQEAFKAGDMNRFSSIASELSAKSPLPFRLIPGQDGNFGVEFRSDAAGGWTDTGRRITPQEAMTEIGNIIGGEQTILAGADLKERRVNPRFLAASARYKMGTILGNAEALADPKKWIALTKGGHTVYAIPQNRHDDYSVGPSYRVLDEKGGTASMVGSMDDLLSQGYVRADVKADIQNKQRIAAGKGASSAGKGGIGSLGSKELRVAILQSGYGYDSTQKWYYKVNTDEEGKAKVDLSQPMSTEFYQELTRKKGTAADGAKSNDGLGIRVSAQNAVAGRPAPPNIPHQQTQPTPPVQSHNAGQLVSYPKNGLLQWALIGKDGQPKEISQEEAKSYAQTHPASLETQPIQVVPRQPRVNINDVLGELTPEEHTEWQISGKLPSRYNQVR